MQQFIGVKLINATPMDRLTYNVYRGWKLPDDENGTDEGFLVEYVDGGEANTPDYKGYVSWSPKGVFEASYRATSGLTFGLAIDAMKLGHKVARIGWNGKGMWVALGRGTKDLDSTKFWNPHTKAHAESQGGTATVDDYLIMKTAGQTICMGWLASQADILAEDWVIL